MEEVGMMSETPGVIQMPKPTPLQTYYLARLQRLVAERDRYFMSPDSEPWLREAIKKSIFGTLMECVESNIGDAAWELVRETE